MTEGSSYEYKTLGEIAPNETCTPDTQKQELVWERVKKHC